MLSLLHIENIAVIEQADLSFECGFNVLTGETGAGKSIVIDAISAILGERTYRDIIRTGAEHGFVSAIFTGIPQLPWFSENQVSYEEEQLLIQREIHLDGKNICRVNGRPVTVAILRRLGQQLISIHGQHDSQQLFDEATHLKLLDLYAHDEALLGTYGERYREVQEIRNEMERLSMDESEKARKMEILQYQIEEIERAELKEGEDEALEARRRLLQNAEKLASGLSEAFTCIQGDDDADGAAAMLTQAERALSRMTRYDSAIEALHAKASDLMYQAMDLAEEARDLRDRLAFSEEELERIEDRLDGIRKLRRKYGATIADILSFLETARRELGEIEMAGERLEELRTSLAGREADARRLPSGFGKREKKRPRALKRESYRNWNSWICPKSGFSASLKRRSCPQTAWIEFVF